MEEQLIAPCGMNCGLCISYLAMKMDINQHGFKKTYCPGCQQRGQHCTFLKKHCDLMGQGLIRFCHECGDYPCKRLKALDKRYRTKYHMSMLENLNLLKEQGMEALLEKETATWTCPECGGTICCHNGLCLRCGLETLRRNKKYRWGEPE